MSALATGMALCLDRLHHSPDVRWIVLQSHRANPRLHLVAPFLLHPTSPDERGHVAVAVDGTRMPLFPGIILCIHEDDVLPEDIQNQEYEAEFSDGTREYDVRHTQHACNAVEDEDLLQALLSARENIEEKLQLQSDADEEAPDVSDCELSPQDLDSKSLRFHWRPDPLRSFVLSWSGGALKLQQEYAVPDKTSFDLITPLRIAQQEIFFDTSGLCEIDADLGRSIEEAFGKVGLVTGASQTYKKHEPRTHVHWPSWAFPSALGVACAALVTVAVLVGKDQRDGSEYSVLAFSTAPASIVLSEGIRGAEGTPDEVYYLRIASDNINGTAMLLERQLSDFDATVSQTRRETGRIELVTTLPSDEASLGKIVSLFDLEAQPSGLLIIEIKSRRE